jgi:8-hydroxy-5-deazaflavin:NADPH oxidoreductase
MRIGVLGTGVVGRTLGEKLGELDHEVRIGSRRADEEQGYVTFADAVNASVMVEPASVPGEHNVFVCGDDDAAKAEAAGLLQGFGWPQESVVDLGGIDAARGLEMYLPLWLRLFQASGTPRVNVALRVGGG